MKKQVPVGLCLAIVCLVVLCVVIFTQAKPRFAVVEFTVNEAIGTQEIATTLRNLLESNILSSDEYELMPQEKIDLLLESQEIQLNVISSAENLKKLELQNISHLITGTIDLIDDTYIITMKLLDVKTGQFIQSLSEIIKNDADTLFEKTATLTTNFIEGLTVGIRQAKPRVVVVEFTGNEAISTQKIATTLRNLVESKMISSDEYAVMPREEIDLLLENQEIQLNVISSAENLKNLNLQNISYLVTGAIELVDDTYILTIKLLDLNTGQFIQSLSEIIKNDADTLFEKTATLTTNFMEGLTVVEDGIRQVESEPKPYKIGDSGPGGGLIFYIDGNRYWEVSEQLGEANWWDAKDLARDYRGGGYDDWYLPTKNELNYIYENLRKKDFIEDDGSLWSSTEGKSGNAWYQGFSDGNQGNYGANSDYGSYMYDARGVRAVKAFIISSGEIAGPAKAESEPESYKIGDRGPGGGLVFYIEGNRYWEVSENLGEANWSDAKDLAKDSHGGYDDWYLPSKDELNYIYENLRKKDFIEDNGWFWASSEFDDSNAWSQRFSDGLQYYGSSTSKGNTLGVRAVRGFSISNGEITELTKAIGDRGPGGGLIFYIEGNRYWEVSEHLGEANWSDAKDLATDYRGGTYDNWYIPTKDELNYIYENLRKKDFIEDDGWLWASSEFDDSNAWSQRFSDGLQYYGSSTSKGNTLGVRAVRGFTLESYKIGDSGPGGGLIFYREGNTYLEASENLGKANWDDALTLATDYRGGGYDDWYLPTIDELNYIYENLRVKDFIKDEGNFWSSTEDYNNYVYVWYQRFSDGNQYGTSNRGTTKDDSLELRAVRAFTISSGEIAGPAKAAKAESDPKAYKIGDSGPGGGIVFYREGNTYLEASESLGKANGDEAMQMAKDYRGGGYDDWYLPSKDELNYIYENLRVKDFIKDDGYFWSSSEGISNYAWTQRFSDGYQTNGYDYNDYLYKTGTLGVRAVRAFNASSL